MKFARADESLTVRFEVKPTPGTAPGEYHVRAIATAAGVSFDRGYEVIEYPHIRRYHIYDAAETTVKVIDVRLPSAPIPRSRTNPAQLRGDMLLRSVSRSGFADAEKPFAIRRTYRGLADIGRR